MSQFTYVDFIELYGCDPLDKIWLPQVIDNGDIFLKLPVNWDNAINIHLAILLSASGLKGNTSIRFVANQLKLLHGKQVPIVEPANADEKAFSNLTLVEIINLAREALVFNSIGLPKTQGEIFEKAKSSLLKENILS